MRVCVFYITNIVVEDKQTPGMSTIVGMHLRIKFPSYSGYLIKDEIDIFGCVLLIYTQK